MPNQFLSPEGDIENYFVSEYWLIDQYIGDQLWSWGLNEFGQLGINNIVTKSTPVTTFAGGTNWKQVSSGNGFVCAVKTDGTLWSWGRNDSNQIGALGTNDTITRSTPVTTFAGGNNWKQVSSSNNSVSAIKTDGTLWTWGRNNYGQLGTNDTTDRSTPVTTFAGSSDWKNISCGSVSVFAIKTDGTLWVWGGGSGGRIGTNDTTNRLTPVTTFAGGNNWKQVSSRSDNSSAVKTDGTLWIWGLNQYGQLGTNNTSSSLTPVTTFAGGTNWKSVRIISHTVAIKTDGTLWTWGRNNYGQLGTNDTTDRSTPVTTFAGGTNWKQCDVNSLGNLYSATSAIKTNGTLWTWGNNDFGHLGINDTITRSTPVTTFAGGTDWKQISSRGRSAFAVTSGISPELSLS